MGSHPEKSAVRRYTCPLFRVGPRLAPYFERPTDSSTVLDLHHHLTFVKAAMTVTKTPTGTPRGKVLLTGKLAISFRDSSRRDQWHRSNTSYRWQRLCCCPCAGLSPPPWVGAPLNLSKFLSSRMSSQIPSRDDSQIRGKRPANRQLYSGPRPAQVRLICCRPEHC